MDIKRCANLSLTTIVFLTITIDDRNLFKNPFHLSFGPNLYPIQPQQLHRSQTLKEPLGVGSLLVRILPSWVKKYVRNNKVWLRGRQLEWNASVLTIFPYFTVHQIKVANKDTKGSIMFQIAQMWIGVQFRQMMSTLQSTEKCSFKSLSPKYRRLRQLFKWH